MGYTRNFCEKTVGSFWKTNPPVRGFGRLLGSFWEKITVDKGIANRSPICPCASQKRSYNRLGSGARHCISNLDCPREGFGV